MAEIPRDLEMSALHTFVAKSMILQKQLDKTYHTNGFLRDRLIIAVDLPAIQSALRDKMPRTSQQVFNKIANQLCYKAWSAGSGAACIASSAPLIVK